MTSTERREFGIGNAKNVDDKGLTPGQRRMLDAYIGDADFDAIKALEIAGYVVEGRTRSALSKTAVKILQMPASKKYLADLAEVDPLCMGRQERLRRLSRIARGERMVEGKLDEKTGEREMWPADMKEQLKAMEMLGKASGEGLSIEITIRPEQLSDSELEAALLAMGRTLPSGDIVDTVAEEATHGQEDDDE